jgi:ABC-type proline/glycine betaine transport system permease subunit
MMPPAIDLPRLHVGDWCAAAVTWVQDNLGPIVDFVNRALSLLNDTISVGLHAVPALLMAAIFALIAWAASSWKLGLGVLVGMLLIDTMDMWGEAMDTLSLVLVCSIVAMALALPIGILAARNAAVSRVVRPVLDFMQTLPVFVYLIPAVLLFDIGIVPGMVATIVFAMPPGVRLTELGIRQVDREMVEAGHAFGAPARQILGQIEVPLAMPTIMAGLNQVIMLALSMVVVAGMLLIETMDMWGDAMDTLSLVLVCSIVAMALALPIGILAARNAAVSRVVRPVLDFMQTLPVFVYLIPAVLLFDIGIVPGMVATIVFAMPPGVRLTELGIRQVDSEMVEAGHAFGAPERQILAQIEVPLAMPTIMAGLNQVIMLALSMVVVAGMVGAGGLGAVVYLGITSMDMPLGFEGGIAVVILAMFLDRITSGLADRAPVARAQKATARA